MNTAIVPGPVWLVLGLKLATLLWTLVWQTLISFGWKILVQLILEMMNHVLNLVHALVLPLIFFPTNLTILLARSHHSPGGLWSILSHLSWCSGWTDAGLVLLRCGGVGAS